MFFFSSFFSYNFPDFRFSEHLPTNIFNSDAGKYCTNPKDTIFLTLILVNKFAKFGFLIEEETIFFMPFSFCLPFFYLLFLDKKEKNALHNIFVFNSNNP